MWRGQQPGQPTGPNLSQMYQQNQQPQGMSQGWRPSGGGANGISNIGGNAIGTNTGRPQMSPAPPMYPQMQDVRQQEQDWVNQNSGEGVNWQEGPGATVPYGGGNTTVNGTTYNAQGQQLDSHGNVAYGDWGSNGGGGGGGGGGGQQGVDRDGGNGQTGPNTPGQPGHQGAQQDYWDPATQSYIYANQQGTGWQAPYSGMTSGEGGPPGGGGGMGMPFTQAQYMSMNPEQRAQANDWMANNMSYAQFGHNAYTGERDFNQAAGQWGLTFAQQQANDAYNQQFAEKQWGGQRQDAAQAQVNWANQFNYEQGMGNRQMTLQEENAIRQQQQWGAGHVLAQNQQGHQQGMDIKQHQLAQLSEEHDYYVATGQLDLAKKTQDQYYNIQQGRLGLDTVVAQRQNEQFYAGQANEMTQHRDRFGLEQELGRGNLALQQNRFGLESELGRGGLALEQELGRGNLALQQNRFGLESELGRGNLALEQELGRGGLALQRDQFGQGQYEFGAQMDFDKQKNAQQYGLAVSDQELDWLMQTGQLDLARQQFGQGQYEFGQEFGLQQAQFGQGQYEFDRQMAQQMAIEQARLAQQERASNVAATGRALAPNARWLRAT